MDLELIDGEIIQIDETYYPLIERFGPWYHDSEDIINIAGINLQCLLGSPNLVQENWN